MHTSESRILKIPQVTWARGESTILPTGATGVIGVSADASKTGIRAPAIGVVRLIRTEPNVPVSPILEKFSSKICQVFSSFEKSSSIFNMNTVIGKMRATVDRRCVEEFLFLVKFK